MISIQQLLDEIEANRARGCVCDRLPADLLALAADPKAHSRECPLYEAPRPAERFGLIGSNDTDHGPDGFPL